MTYPTQEEIRQIAIECGFSATVVYMTHEEELQAFATRMIKIGRKMQREESNCAEVNISNNTGE